MSTTVLATRKFEKELSKIPLHIQESFRVWVATVELIGIRATRRLPGYHDEPLKGDRKGQRSVRLSRAYRVLYVETKEGIEITLIEVNKHAY